MGSFRRMFTTTIVATVFTATTRTISTTVMTTTINACAVLPVCDAFAVLHHSLHPHRHRRPFLEVFRTSNSRVEAKKGRRNSSSKNGPGGAGGGFGASSTRKKETNVSKKKRPDWAASSKSRDDDLNNFRNEGSTSNDNDDNVMLDKWGLPPPTMEDIFPPLHPDTELIPAESGKRYTVEEIQTALTDYLPTLDLSWLTTADSAADADDHSNSSISEPQQRTLTLAHVSPPVLVIDNFLSADDCHDTWAVTAENDTNANLPSVVRMDSATVSSTLAHSIRTSTSWFCHYATVPALLAVATRLGLPLAHLEEPQLVRYRPGQEFSWHEDALPATTSTTESNGGQRLATLLVYLNTLGNGGDKNSNDDDSTKSGSGGGATCFRDLRDPRGQPLQVHPRQGRALLFFPANARGIPDERTLHQGQAVLHEKNANNDDDKCEKRIAQVWVHQGPYTAAVPPGNWQKDAVDSIRHVSQQLGWSSIMEEETAADKQCKTHTHQKKNRRDYDVRNS